MNLRARIRRTVLVALIAPLLFENAIAEEQEEPKPLVFAASSLTNVLGEQLSGDAALHSGSDQLLGAMKPFMETPGKRYIYAYTLMIGTVRAGKPPGLVREVRQF